MYTKLLTIDAHEPALVRNLAQAMATEQKIPNEIKELLTGDFAWDSVMGTWLVERKAASDLLSSLSGRGPEQFARLVASCDVPVLLIEGRIGDFGGLADSRSSKYQKDHHGRWSFEAMDHALLTWQMAGMYVAHSPSTTATPGAIVGLYKWSQKGTHSGGLRKKRLVLAG